MNEETINEVVKRYYGHSVEELNNMIAYWMNKYHKEKAKNKELLKILKGSDNK